MTDTFTVLNPMGFPPKVVTKSLAPRLSSLDGKTVYLVDCRFDDSDVFLKQVQAWFTQHMPSVRTVFKQISSVYLKDDPEMEAFLVDEGVDGAQLDLANGERLIGADLRALVVSASFAGLGPGSGRTAG